MSFNVFEAAIGSDHEVAMAKQASVDKMSAAVYDVREKLGPILFASADVEEFRHKVAMMKNDQSVFKIIEASGLFPSTGTVRRIVGQNGVLEQEFRQHLADNGIPGVSPNPEIAPQSPNEFGPSARPPVSGPLQDPMSGSPQMVGRRHEACWPGCHENEAHAAKFHAGDKDKKESRRQQGVYDTIDHPKWDNGTVDTNETFQGGKTDTELKPKGDFKGYLNKVDQGAPSKIERNFSGDGTRHTEDPAKHNFASKATVARYAKFCKQRGLSPIRMSSLDTFSEASGLTTSGYLRLATTIIAWENEHKPEVPDTKLKKKDKVAGTHDFAEGSYGNPNWGTHPNLIRPPDGQPHLQKSLGRPYRGEGQHRDDDQRGIPDGKPVWGARDPMRPYKAWCRKHGLRMISARNINHYAQNDPQLAYFLAMRCKEAIRTARRRQGGRRTAAPDYLQKADDALTQLLNTKAEEFQQTIAPLQQALITVQQAEQLQQQQNPLNVLPPPGTVNVMPGQAQSPASQLGMPDPNQPDISGLVQALQPGGGAMGGVAPQGGAPGGGAPADAGAPPPAAAGGGLPPDLDPSAQKAAHRGKGKGVTRPRQAAGVGQMWDNWRSKKEQGGEALRGGDPDYEAFQQETGAGERAMNNLKQRNQTPDFAPINGQRPVSPPKSSQGLTVGRRKQAWSGWGPAVAPPARKVAGWDWNDHQNGYLTNSPRHFECSCGEQFPAPSGFHRCACGKQWNSYVIGTGGSGHKEASADTFIVREVPVRPDVIVANRKMSSYTPTLKLVDPRTGTIHNLIDPGEVGEGEDPGHSTFRKQPKDWARRGGDGKWQGNQIG